MSREINPPPDKYNQPYTNGHRLPNVRPGNVNFQGHNRVEKKPIQSTVLPHENPLLRFVKTRRALAIGLLAAATVGGTGVCASTVLKDFHPSIPHFGLPSLPSLPLPAFPNFSSQHRHLTLLPAPSTPEQAPTAPLIFLPDEGHLYNEQPGDRALPADISITRLQLQTIRAGLSPEDRATNIIPDHSPEVNTPKYQASEAAKIDEILLGIESPYAGEGSTYMRLGNVFGVSDVLGVYMTYKMNMLLNAKAAATELKTSYGGSDYVCVPDKDNPNVGAPMNEGLLQYAASMGIDILAACTPEGKANFLLHPEEGENGKADARQRSLSFIYAVVGARQDAYLATDIVTIAEKLYPDNEEQQKLVVSEYSEVEHLWNSEKGEFSPIIEWYRTKMGLKPLHP
jgi:hypothetical protein